MQTHNFCGVALKFYILSGRLPYGEYHCFTQVVRQLFFEDDKMLSYYMSTYIATEGQQLIFYHIPMHEYEISYQRNL